MTRIPVLDPDDMDDAQRAIHDRILADGGRIGFGPAIGYAYSGPVWNSHNKSSAHLLDCSLTNIQVRIISLMTVRHWKAAYPWSAQAKTAVKAGLSLDIIDAINEGRDPEFATADDAAVYSATKELLETGNLSDDGFAAAEKALGYQRIVELVGAIGHFCTTGLMANVVGVTPDPEAPSHLKS
jgi:4-carboxymuconolactone decarboxylase